MKKLALKHYLIVALTGLAMTFGYAGMAHSKQILDSIHFLIPGGTGGGWDATARGTGEALTKSGIIESASYENLSGGGSGKALGHLIENAASNYNTLMVNSTPIVIRSLTGIFPYNFRDLTLVSGTIGDYAALVVPVDSDIKDARDFISAFKKDPSALAVGGGSVPGGMDHLVAAIILQDADANPAKMKYIAYDAGGKAMAALLSGEIKVLATGFSETINMVKSGIVRVIGVTSKERVDTLPEAKTFVEQGIDTYFVNWRGFFAAPGLPKDKLEKFKAVIAAMYDTPEWEEVRARNGWVKIHTPGDKFMTFLEQQELVIKDLMLKLGFL